MGKKRIWIIVAAVAIVLVVIYIILAATGNLKPSNEESSSSEPSDSVVNEISFGWKAENAQSEEGTSARVDEITTSASEAAKNMDEDQAVSAWDEAIQYLKEHVDNFYENTEVMEHSMYYGEFIYRYIEANAAASNISELPDSTRTAYDAGYNTVKAIKYVYRGAEKIEDESTQSSLSEAKEALDKFQ